MSRMVCRRANKKCSDQHLQIRRRSLKCSQILSQVSKQALLRQYSPQHPANFSNRIEKSTIRMDREAGGKIKIVNRIEEETSEKMCKSNLEEIHLSGYQLR